MLHKDRNFCHRDPPCEDGDVFETSNLAQLYPHTPICVGKRGLRFRTCNLVNCDLPPDAVVEDCAHHHVSRCAHLHPKWGLKAEPETCEHVTEVHEVRVDGVAVMTEYVRADRRVD